MSKKPAIGYCRVSTAEQGKSGLGLEAQQAAILRYCEAHGYDKPDFVHEVMSGGDNNRPALNQALQQAKLSGADIIVAKLDRLSRDVHFISGLMRDGAPIYAADLPPDTPPFMLHIMAAMAEEERRRIGQRTREALAAKRAQGVKLGSPSPERGGRAAGRLLAQQADNRAEVYRKPVQAAVRAGCNTIEQLVEFLTDMGVRSPRGRDLHRNTVARIVSRLGIKL